MNNSITDEFPSSPTPRKWGHPILRWLTKSIGTRQSYVNNLHGHLYGFLAICQIFVVPNGTFDGRLEQTGNYTFIPIGKTQPENDSKEQHHYESYAATPSER
jgi:hypothetical protein